MSVDSDGEIAFLVTEPPDRPDTFSAEVHHLVLAGVRLHVFSLIPPTELPALAEFAGVAIPLTCIARPAAACPAARSDRGLRRVAAVSALHLRLVRRSARAYLATFSMVATMYCKASPLRASRRGELLEDFLLAVEIAASVLDAGTVRHVHGHDGNRTSTRAWLVSRLTGLPFSFSANAAPTPEHGSDREPPWCRQKLLAARFVVARTKTARRQLTRALPQAGSIHSVYHGINTQYFRPPPAAHRSSAPVILSVGRFEESSGFEYLIAACAQLKAAGVDCCCWLIGPEGPHSRAVLRTIETLGLTDRVSTYGSVTPNQLRHLLHHASVFALPRVQTGQDDRDDIPQGLAEAMASGVAVVATATGNLTEVLEHGKNGILVRERDSRSLARVVQVLLGSPALRRRLGASGRQTACQAFDIRSTADLLKALLETVAPDPRALPDAAEESDRIPLQPRAAGQAGWTAGTPEPIVTAS